MTSLFDVAAAAPPVAAIVQAEGLFAARRPESILPLEFGPAFPAAVELPEVPEEVTAEISEAQDRAQQMRLMVDAAREEAVRETRALLEAEHAEAIVAERHRVMSVLALFGEERARWFRRAEGELVELTLAIARRVLDREMRTDPLCLQEVARAAVNRVQEESGVILRVAPQHVADWRGAFAGRTDLEVQADPLVPAGEVVVDTTFGRVEVGIGTQLEEISERFRELVGGPRRVRVRADTAG